MIRALHSTDFPILSVTSLWSDSKNMNKLVLSALVATVAVGTASANEGPDWSGLDSELNKLSSTLNFGDGLSFGGYLEATYDTDAQDWATGRNRVTASGGNGGFGYHLSIQGSEEADAFVTFNQAGIDWTMGNFRRPTTSNHLENEGDMHFMDRSALGASGAEAGGGRTSGLMATGGSDGMGWKIHYGSDELFTARVTYDVMSGDGMNLSIAYSIGETSAIGDWFEAHLSNGPFGLSATTGDDDSGGANSASVYVASYDINDTMTLGLRQTDHDDGNDATMDLALTCDCDGARWTFQQNDEEDLMIGCIVGF